MHKTVTAGLWALAYALSHGQATAAEVKIVAKEKGVQVLQEPKKAAAAIMTLDKDQSVPSGGEREGMYWVVTVNGGKGYVSVLQSTRQNVDSGLTDALRNAVKQGRTDDDVTASRTRSTVMGVRGLDDSGEVSFAGSVRPNLRMVYLMEDYNIPADEVDQVQEDVFKEIEARTNKR